MLRLRPSNITPPDNFRFKCPIDGFVVTAIDRGVWFSKIRDHYRDNGYELPADIEAQAQDQICRLLPCEWCEHDGEGALPKPIERRLRLDNVKHGTRVLLKFIKDGHPLVSQEVAEERARTCAMCFALDNVPGCNSCAGIANIVAELCGAKSTKSDAALGEKACLVCKCSARANAWVPVEVSRVGVTEEMLEQFDSIPHCWKGREIRALQQRELTSAQSGG